MSPSCPPNPLLPLTRDPVALSWVFKLLPHDLNIWPACPLPTIKLRRRTCEHKPLQNTNCLFVCLCLCFLILVFNPCCVEVGQPQTYLRTFWRSAHKWHASLFFFFCLTLPVPDYLCWDVLLCLVCDSSNTVLIG